MCCIASIPIYKHIGIIFTTRTSREKQEASSSAIHIIIKVHEVNACDTASLCEIYDLDGFDTTCIKQDKLTFILRGQNTGIVNSAINVGIIILNRYENKKYFIN